MDQLENPANRTQMIKSLMYQMETIGFLTINNSKEFNETELLTAMKAFHEIPMEQKDQLKLKHFNPENSNIYRGFFPFLPNDPSHKEFFDQGRPLNDIPESEVKKWPMYE